jgi:hypothetical protein
MQYDVVRIDKQTLKEMIDLLEEKMVTNTYEDDEYDLYYDFKKIGKNAFTDEKYLNATLRLYEEIKEIQSEIKDWELKRKEFYARKSWDVKESVNDKMYKYRKALDYSTKDPKERLKIVKNIVENDQWLVDYVSSPMFAIKQWKKQNDFLSEDDTFCKGIDQLANYLVYSMKKEGKHDREIINDDRKEYLSKKEDKTIDVSTYVVKDTYEEYATRQYKSRKNQTKNYKLKPKLKVTDQDRVKYSYVDVDGKVRFPLLETQEYCKHIQEIADIQQMFITNGLYKNEQDLINLIKNIAIIKKTITNIRQEEVWIKDKMKRDIVFKKLLSDETKYDFDMWTGYVKPNGIYKLVTEGKLDLTNYIHIRHLLKLFCELDNQTFFECRSDIKHILLYLEDVINNMKMKPLYKDIVTMRMNGAENVLIQDEIKRLYGKNLSEVTIARILEKTIPRMIAKEIKKHELIFKHKNTKGAQWKVCVKCGDNLPATIDFYSPDQKRNDGLFVYCKSCNK